jgi:uncharacterized membrane protein
LRLVRDILLALYRRILRSFICGLIAGSSIMRWYPSDVQLSACCPKFANEILNGNDNGLA